MADSTIVCVSANPAMDRRLHVASLEAGEVNRAKSARGLAGGKAAHVAMAAHALGANASWIGFLGGAIGEECARQLESMDIEVVAVRTTTSTRVNLEVIEDSGKVTEILEPGAAPTREETAEFVRVCSERIREEGKASLLVISGSLPSGISPDFYVSLIEAARNAGARVFIDTSGEALGESVKANPDLVKVNRAEAEALLGRSLKSRQETTEAAREIIRRGSSSAAITLGKDGLVWIEHRDGPVWIARPPSARVVSTVGSGDATLAGFAYAAIQGIVGEEAVRLAAACGAANCAASSPGMINFADAQRLLPQIEVQKMTF
jgi:1-phosphofructokinase family hexose kinase